MNKYIPKITQYLTGQKKAVIDAGIYYGDIKGFTAVTELLLNEGKAGVEKLSEIINKLYGSIEDIMNKENGYIYNYSGDAFFAVFPEKFNSMDLDRKILLFIDGFPTIKVDQKEIKIGIKTGFSEGRINIQTINTSGKRVLCIFGDPVKNACELKKQGITSTYPNIKEPRTAKNSDLIPNINIFHADNEFRNTVSLFIGLRPGENNIDTVFNRQVLEAIAEYKGFFNQIEYGDKGFVLPVFFGIPLMEPEFIENALNCCQKIRQLCEKNKEHIEIGITFGKVLAGFIGGKRFQQYTALGDKVNTACRLMQHSKNNIILSEGESIGHLEAEWEDSGIIEIKGKGLPMNIFSLRSLNKNKKEKMFVGRMNVVDEIEKLYKKKKNQILVISGNAGMGKTFLVENILDKLKYVLSFSYYLIKEGFLLSDIINGVLEKIKSSFSTAEILSSVKEESELEIFKYFLNAEHSNIYIDSMNEKEKRELSINVIIQLFNLSKGKKVLFFDDITFFNEELKVFIASLQGKCKDIFIISTHRGDFSELRLGLDGIVNIHLEGFGEKELFEILKRNDLNNIDAEFKKNIIKRTEGVPFYIVQIVDYIKREKISDLKKIPASIENIIISRFDSMSKEIKLFLKNAACYGKVFDIQVIAKMISGNMITIAVESVKNEEIIEKLNKMNYIFKHMMFRDVIYGIILNKDLRIIHSLLARLLMQTNPERREMIAIHLEKAGKYEKAAEYYHNLGEKSTIMQFYSQADNYFKKTFELSKNRSLIKKTSIQHSLVMSFMGRHEDAIGLLKKNPDFINHTSALKTLVDIYINQHDYKNAKITIDKLKRRKGQYSFIMMNYARIYFQTGELKNAIVNYERAFNEKTDRLDKIKIHSNIGISYTMMGDYKKANEYFLKAKKMTLHAKSFNYLRFIYINMGVNHYQMYRYKRSLNYFLKAYDIAKKVGDFNYFPIVLSNIGGIYVLMGDMKNAEIYLKQGIEYALRNNDNKYYATLVLNLVNIHQFYCRDEEAMEGIRTTIKIKEKYNDTRGIGNAHYSLGSIYENMGNKKKALEHYKKSVDIFEKTEYKLELSACFSYYYKQLFYFGRYAEIEKKIDKHIENSRQYDKANLMLSLLIKAGILYKSGKKEQFNEIVKDAYKLIEGISGRVLYGIMLYEITGGERYKEKLISLRKKIEPGTNLYRNIGRLAK